MNIHDSLISVFPNTVNKEGEMFGAIVANSKNSGVFEEALNKVKKFIAQWTGTPDLYKQTGEMLEITANFFSFFERYTDESDEAFLKRISTIFQRGGDTKWGNPYDIKKLFSNYFPSAKIYLVENTNHIDDNLLVDGDFQTKNDAWTGIDSDQESLCHYSKLAKFSKTYGVEVFKNGTFSQTITNDISDKEYSVTVDDSYTTIAKKQYGNELLADYISSYKDNPVTITGPVKGTCNVVFSRTIAKDEEIIIPTGTVISNGDNEYLLLNDAVIEADESATKSSGTVIFSRSEQMDEESEIPLGTKVSDGIHIFQTTEEGKIISRATSSDEIPIIAVEYGEDYNVAKNTITTIVSNISLDIVEVTNPNAIHNGFNGNKLNSNVVTAEARNTGISSNTDVNTITTIISELPEVLSVKNTTAVSNGNNGDVILIPSRKTYFLHFFLNGKMKVQITDNNGRYWNNKHYFNSDTAKWVDGGWQTEEFSINYDTIKEMKEHNENDPEHIIQPTKAEGNVYFTCQNPSSKRIEIPIGTRVAKDDYVYITTTRGYIDEGNTVSQEVGIIAENSGWEYNQPANSINQIIDVIEGVDSVYNEKVIGGGTDSDWTKESLYFYTDNTIESITITFIAADRCYIDYIRLFEKQYYPSFSIIAQFQTYSGVDAAALYPGEEDPVLYPSHDNASYFDNDYFTGVSNGGFSQDLYQDIMDYVRSVGVKAYVELVNKDDD